MFYAYFYEIIILIGGWDEHFITHYFFLVIFRNYYNLNIYINLNILST